MKISSFILCIISMIIVGQSKLRTQPTYTLYDFFTEAIAYEMGYYDLYNDLRYKAYVYIGELSAKAEDFLMTLRRNGKNIVADKKAYIFSIQIDDISDLFDLLFKGIDEEFLINARRLDHCYAPLDVKRAFIETHKQKLRDIILPRLQKPFPLSLNC